jgi:hypothetical protein
MSDDEDRRNYSDEEGEDVGFDDSDRDEDDSEDEDDDDEEELKKVSTRGRVRIPRCPSAPLLTLD